MFMERSYALIYTKPRLRPYGIMHKIWGRGHMRGATGSPQRLASLDRQTSSDPTGLPREMVGFLRILKPLRRPVT